MPAATQDDASLERGCAMGYPGGKAGSGVYQRIINEIPPHDVYVEACLGDGAVLLRKRPALRNIGVEIDPEQARNFSATWGPGAGFSDGADGDRIYCPTNLELYNCCGVEWLRHTFGLYRVGGILPPDHATVDRDRGTLDDAAVDGNFQRPSQNLAAAAAVAGFGGGEVARKFRLGRSDGSHNQAAAAAGSRDARSPGPTRFSCWFVYLDPPYLLSSRRSSKRLYRYEMTKEQHVELLDVATRLPCMVAISGYHSPLYDATLQTWRRIEFTAMTRGGRLAREVLWMNYAAPAELHDYRYLGDNKRVRERIARKRRTWAAGLRRLPPLERQAVLAEMLT